MEQELEQIKKENLMDIKIEDQEKAEENRINFEYQNIVVLRAREGDLDLIKRDWPYSDYSFDAWKENGMLVTSENVPSKLNEHQYRQVRTSAFKEFFGDWQKDPENSSQVVDKTSGEPMVLYRGDGSRYSDSYTTKPDSLRDKEIKNDQGIFFTNSYEVARSYSEDISGHLGVYGKNYEVDHPETFEQTRDYVLSVINSDPAFWYKVYVSHLPNHEQFRGQISSTDSGEREKIESVIRRDLNATLSNDLVDQLINNFKRHGFAAPIDSSKVVDEFVKAGKFEEILKMVQTYFHGGDQNFSQSETKISKTAQSLSFDKDRNFRLEPRDIKSVFVNARNVALISSNSTFSGPEISNFRKSGHDLAIGRYAVGGGKAHEYIVFDPKNIKSAINNNGRFNPNSGKLND